MNFTKIDYAMMETAYVWSKLSYCERRKVGAVITRDNGIISHGYNGTAPGQENVCEYKYITCPCGIDIDVSNVNYHHRTLCNTDIPTAIVNCDCGISNRFTEDFTKLKTHPYVMHAEANAITRAARLGIALEGSDIYTTTLPCNECAKMIVSSGIKKVYYVESYKADLTVKYLKDNKIELIRMEKINNV